MLRIESQSLHLPTPASAPCHPRDYIAEKHSGFLPCPFLGPQEYLYRPICPPTSHLNKGGAFGCSLTGQIAALAKVVPIPANTLPPHSVRCFSKLITSIIYENPQGFQLPGNLAVGAWDARPVGMFLVSPHTLPPLPHILVSAVGQMPSGGQSTRSSVTGLYSLQPFPRLRGC